ALCLRRQRRSLNVAAKAFPWHQPIDGLKRIALRRECRQPIIRIEESELPHRASPRIMARGSRLARVRKIGYFSRCPLLRLSTDRYHYMGSSKGSDPTG